jgi:p-aminobenzoyl-glutamate transporter AbgT
MSQSPETPKAKRSPIVAFLDLIEWLGNKLPDPAVLFVGGILLVWLLSAVCSPIPFTETLPGQKDPIRIVNLLTLEKFADFLAKMTEHFVGFHPLGVVLVAMLGVGVAEHSGFINAVLKTMLGIEVKTERSETSQRSWRFFPLMKSAEFQNSANQRWRSVM